MESHSEPAKKTVSSSIKNLTNKTKGIGIAILAAAVVLSFLGGMQLEKAQQRHKPLGATRPFDDTGMGMSGFMGRAGRMGSNLRVVGQVTAVSGSSITVNDMRRGGSTTFTITSATKVINNGAAAAVSDIKTGDTVMIQKSGTTSTEALQITITPSFGSGQNQNYSTN